MWGGNCILAIRPCNNNTPDSFSWNRISSPFLLNLTENHQLGPMITHLTKTVLTAFKKSIFSKKVTYALRCILDKNVKVGQPWNQLKSSLWHRQQDSEQFKTNWRNNIHLKIDESFKLKIFCLWKYQNVFIPLLA